MMLKRNAWDHGIEFFWEYKISFVVRTVRNVANEEISPRTRYSILISINLSKMQQLKLFQIFIHQFCIIQQEFLTQARHYDALIIFDFGCVLFCLFGV